MNFEFDFNLISRFVSVFQQKHDFAEKVKDIKIDSDRLKEIEKSPSGWVPPAGTISAFFISTASKQRHTNNGHPVPFCAILKVQGLLNRGIQ